MNEEEDFDGLLTYATEEADGDREVPDPERRKHSKKINELNERLQALTREYGERALENQEGRRPTRIQDREWGSRSGDPRSNGGAGPVSAALRLASGQGPRAEDTQRRRAAAGSRRDPAPDQLFSNCSLPRRISAPRTPQAALSAVASGWTGDHPVDASEQRGPPGA